MRMMMMIYFYKILPRSCHKTKYFFVMVRARLGPVGREISIHSVQNWTAYRLSLNAQLETYSPDSPALAKQVSHNVISTARESCYFSSDVRITDANTVILIFGVILKWKEKIISFSLSCSVVSSYISSTVYFKKTSECLSCT